MDEIERLKSRRADLACMAPEWLWAGAVRDMALTTGETRKPFIVQGTAEDPEDYKTRCNLAEYAPVTPLIAERIEGAVFKRPPQVLAPDALSDFIAQATPDGRDINELVRDACLDALWGRFAVVLIDRPAMQGEAPANAAEAAAQGLDKPYAVIYTAEQVLDYRQDRMGLLEYVKLDGPVYARGGAQVREIREVDANGIRVSRIIKDAGGKETLDQDAPVPLAEGLAAAKRLPVVPARFKAIDAMQGRSPLAPALVAEKGALRLLADITFDLWIAGHPTTVVHTVAESIGQIGIGASSYLKLRPKSATDEGDSIEYLEAALPGLTKQIERYAAARQEIQQQAGVRPISADYEGAQPESGVAATVKNESEAYVLGNCADMAADVAFDILSVVALDMGAVPADGLAEAISVSYSKDFSLQSAERMLATAQTFRGLLGPSSAATKEALRRAVIATLDNIDPKLEAQIKKEIESTGAYQPPAPSFEPSV